MKTPEEIYNEHTRGWDDYRQIYNTDCIKMMETYASQLKPEMPTDIKLPDFLYEDDGEIKIGRHGDSVVTDEWNKWMRDLISKQIEK